MDRRVHLGNPRPLLDLAAFCDESVVAAVGMANGYFPRVEGVSGGVVQLFFIARPSGPKLWFSY